MIHVDAFLYDDDFVDSLCEEGKMSRSYCTECGSYKTASLGKCSFVNMSSKFSLTRLIRAVTQLGSTSGRWRTLDAVHRLKLFPVTNGRRVLHV